MGARCRVGTDHPRDKAQGRCAELPLCIHPGHVAELDVQLQRVARLFKARTGIDLSGPLSGHAAAGIRRAMERLGETDTSSFREAVERDPRAIDALVTELAVNETYFFREARHFELIADEILPEVAPRGLRAWSAGCASGEEIYSLAMLLAEHDALEQAHLVGTDLSRAALERAREGCYRPWSLRGEGADRARRWLTERGSGLILDEDLRRRVTLLRLNLATDRYPESALGLAHMDLVLCRNVLIYFDAATVARVAQGLHDTLAPGGWLLTGASDPPLAEHADLEPAVWRDVVVYRRRSERRPARAAPAPRAPARPAPSRRPSRPMPSVAPSPSTSLAPSPARPAEPAVARVRALADQAPRAALRECEAALSAEPLSAELHHLDAVLRLGLCDDAGAEASLKRALYLDPSLAVTHFVLGSVLRTRGDLDGARRSFRNARERACALPADAPLPLTDGQTAGHLAEAARAQLEALGGLA